MAVPPLSTPSPCGFVSDGSPGPRSSHSTRRGP
jgi:hypothetical protein